MRIIFLNTWDGKQEKEIINFLEKEKYETDVFCFQEVNTTMQEICEKNIPEFTRIMTNKLGSESCTYNNASYIKSDIEIIESDVILNKDTTLGLALFVKINYKNKIMNIINVHGTPTPGDKTDTEYRLKQSREIINYTKNFRDPIIAGGDFNLDNNTKSVNIFESYQFNNLIEEFGIKTTRNEISWSKYTNKQYYADFIFTKNVSVKSFNVPDSNISDHLALILEI